MVEIQFSDAYVSYGDCGSFPLLVPQEEDSGVEEMELLKTLVVNLRHLCDLYVKYNCKLTLSEFEMV